MGGWWEVDARKKWRPKWGGSLKRAGRPEGIRGWIKVVAEKGWEMEKRWETGGK